jgi:hypothetical protein
MISLAFFYVQGTKIRLPSIELGEYKDGVPQIEEIVVNSIQISFLNERMVHTTEAPAQSGRAFNSAF